jgi:hypothetical protein
MLLEVLQPLRPNEYCKSGKAEDIVCLDRLLKLYIQTVQDQFRSQNV